MQDWLNRLGLTLQFLAVWFVTPQIIGEDLLLKAGKSLSATAHSWSNRMKKVGKYGCGLALWLGGASMAPLAIADFLEALHVTHSVGRWMLIVVLSPWWLAAGVFFVAILVLPVISGLGWLVSTSTRSIHALLIAGVILFTVGFVVLMAATWTHT